MSEGWNFILNSWHDKTKPYQLVLLEADGLRLLSLAIISDISTACTVLSLVQRSQLEAHWFSKQHHRFSPIKACMCKAAARLLMVQSTSGCSGPSRRRWMSSALLATFTVLCGHGNQPFQLRFSTASSLSLSSRHPPGTVQYKNSITSMLSSHIWSPLKKKKKKNSNHLYSNEINRTKNLQIISQRHVFRQHSPPASADSVYLPSSWSSAARLLAAMRASGWFWGESFQFRYHEKIGFTPQNVGFGWFWYVFCLYVFFQNHPFWVISGSSHSYRFKQIKTSKLKQSRMDPKILSMISSPMKRFMTSKVCRDRAVASSRLP